MSAFLITGNPGSGKTTIARELSRRELIAVDADETAHWETTSGEPAGRPEHASDEWLLGHRRVWSRPRIEDVTRPHVNARRHIFLEATRHAGQRRPERGPEGADPRGPADVRTRDGGPRER